VCVGGMAEMQITLWGHRPGFRCLAVSGADNIIVNKLVVFDFITLYLMLHTQWGCLNSKLNPTKKERKKKKSVIYISYITLQTALRVKVPSIHNINPFMLAVNHSEHTQCVVKKRKSLKVVASEMKSNCSHSHHSQITPSI